MCAVWLTITYLEEYCISRWDVLHHVTRDVVN
jgi:hypothetical protein